MPVRRLRRAVMVAVLLMGLLLLAVTSWRGPEDMRLHTSTSEQIEALRNHMQQLGPERRGPPQWVPPPFGGSLTHT